MPRPPVPGRLIDIGGFRLHLHCSGSGRPAVILDSALGGSSVSWSLVQPEVARFAHVCSYDRAGFGWSDAGPMPRTAGRIAGELRELLQRAAVEPPFLLVGHSFGGLVMRIFAKRYRADTAALLLVDPAHPENWVRPAPKEQAKIDRGVMLCRYGSRAARFRVAHLVGILASLGAFGAAEALVKVVSLGRLSKEDEGILAPVWRLPQEARRPLRWFWSQARFFDALGSQIASISVSAAETLEASAGGYGDLPLMTISSTDPGEYRLAQQEALARLSSRGRHIVATASGHWIPLDQPQVVIDAVRELIAETGH
ncbi:MAG TPA: alpha/beta hydrolase [Vicinamibacterales bacterium]|nr:alpha/beta hydrolase [Vicinamibacterales bacterium]